MYESGEFPARPGTALPHMPALPSDGMEAGALDEDLLDRFAHRLRSLLTSIDAAANYMLENDMDPRVEAEMLSIIAEQTSRIGGLLEDFEVVAGDAAVTTEPAMVDLYNVARQVVRDLAAEAQSAGVWLVLDAGGPIPAVFGDMSTLRQAVMTTLRSIINLARAGERVVLRLGDGTDPDGEPIVELTVKVSSNDVRLHERAASLNLSDLSLDATRRICERHGGDITLLEDRPGVVCSLPAAPAEPPPAAAAGGMSALWRA